MQLISFLTNVADLVHFRHFTTANISSLPQTHHTSSEITVQKCYRAEYPSICVHIYSQRVIKVGGRVFDHFASTITTPTTPTPFPHQSLHPHTPHINNKYPRHIMHSHNTHSRANEVTLCANVENSPTSPLTHNNAPLFTTTPPQRQRLM